MHIDKRGIRALGVSESFIKSKSRRSILAGVVMRSDLIVDGFSFARTTVGGTDATASVVELYRRLDRRDINIILLNGCVISWFNIISLGEVHRDTELPLICITYEESEGLERYFTEYFRDEAEERIRRYRENGEREELKLHTGKTVFARYLGIERGDAARVLNRFTLQGSVPDPLRVARLLARRIAQQLSETTL
ncbi:DUF99 family protein [Candidatus Bathyarchaeota archaeon]|nr:DUF99 family protein [Candidatus Bathyarchaeota archaeon]